ncbi:nicotinate phosphoribosyltransferase [Actinomycetaceae bacterium WB03_NA08]|uniref:Nicotinate phosphoribosyltransferase n=1 Tax=Scrofimicrobium canadense TaxID=2652290 RepID=A0A6N7VU05_9ACTO|nr:nicotinate phosphoribosyltransferase [Scrofimicrobium canadense]MSS85259.1 nicotinate phosphoribosyltransferase [Scrofimicrobium canadense]
MAASLSTALLTDKYELTMVDAALASGAAERRVTFELFGRKLPPTRRFGVVAGTGRILEALERFEFSDDQIAWLEAQDYLAPATLEYLRNFRFSGDIYGYAEGECYFPGSPLLTVEGTFAECTLLETLLLSVLNFDCAVASAASRMTIAAHGRPCIDMGARRTHERAAVSAARAAVIGGFVSTSDLEAGKRYDLETVGTSAHSFTLLYESEPEAFAAQVARLGPSTTLLVDTYDIAKGVENAVAAARAAGGELGAVRLDSGDLVAHAFKVRGQLDSLGAHTTRITVTSDLDEYAIAALGAAPVDSYGVGTRVVTGSGVPTAALVYKLVEREGVPVAKESESKQTIGGRKVAGRLFDDEGYASEELLVTGGTWEETQSVLKDAGARPLQHKIVDGGMLDPNLWGPGAVEEAAAHHRRSRNELPYPAWRLSEGEPGIPTRVSAIEDVRS